MSSTYAGSTAAFAANITIPSDGDPRPAASVNVAFEALADRTAYLHAKTTMIVDHYTANGTWTCPANVTYVQIQGCGGGGGGAGGTNGTTNTAHLPRGGGGGASAITRTITAAVTPGAAYAIVIGAGGSYGAGGVDGGAFAADGTDGGTSSFGTAVPLRFLGGRGGRAFRVDIHGLGDPDYTGAGGTRVAPWAVGDAQWWLVGGQQDGGNGGFGSIDARAGGDSASHAGGVAGTMGADSGSYQGGGGGGGGGGVNQLLGSVVAAGGGAGGAGNNAGTGVNGSAGSTAAAPGGGGGGGGGAGCGSAAGGVGGHGGAGADGDIRISYVSFA